MDRDDTSRTLMDRDAEHGKCLRTPASTLCTSKTHTHSTCRSLHVLERSWFQALVQRHCSWFHSCSNARAFRRTQMRRAMEEPQPTIAGGYDAHDRWSARTICRQKTTTRWAGTRTAKGEIAPVMSSSRACRCPSRLTMSSAASRCLKCEPKRLEL